MSDLRPQLARVLARVAEGKSVWTTWHGERLLLSPVPVTVLVDGGATVVVATRRGYRLVDLEPARPRAGVGPAVLRDGAGVIEAKRVRAVVVERHPRPSASGTVALPNRRSPYNSTDG